MSLRRPDLQAWDIRTKLLRDQFLAAVAVFQANSWHTIYMYVLADLEGVRGFSTVSRFGWGGFASGLLLGG